MEISLELKKQYIARREKDLEDFVVAIDQKNAAYFIRVGHQLKGNALTYGFPELGLLGAKLEDAALTDNWDLIIICAASFKELVLALPMRIHCASE